MFFKTSGIFLLFFLSFNSFSQVDTLLSNESSNRATTKVSNSTVYFAGQFFRANRNFEDLSIDQRYDSINFQTGVNTGGFEAGMLINLTNNLALSIGANFFGGGERWEFSDSISDSLFTYTNKYRQIAVPIRLNLAFGNQLKGYGFLGAIPSSILSRRYESSFKNENGSITENDIATTEENINSFQFIGTAGAGVSFDFDGASIFAQVEYRHHFSNTYTGLFLNHQQYLIGGSVGLTFSF